MAKKPWTYFNPDYKFRKVDEFCAWYVSGNEDKVRTTNSFRYRPTAEEVLTFIRENPKLFERKGDAYFMSPLVGTYSTFQISEGFIRSLTYEDKPDKRFNDLKELIHRWVGIVKTDGDNQEALVEKLWPLIALLSEENRIDEGKGFHLENYGESDSARLNARLDNVEKRVGHIENNPILKRGIPV